MIQRALLLTVVILSMGFAPAPVYRPKPDLRRYTRNREERSRTRVLSGCKTRLVRWRVTVFIDGSLRNRLSENGESVLRELQFG